MGLPTGTLESGDLLERDAELQALRETLHSVSGGDGAALVIMGDAGLGKTRLLGAVRKLARRGRMAICTARAAELESSFGYGVVRQLFADLLATDPGSDDVFAGAAGVARSVLGGAASPADVEPFAARYGLYWLVANLAARQPLLVAIDDLHWCDEASVEWLRFALGRLESLPVAFVATARPSEPGVDLAWLDELAGEPSVRTIELSPLSGRAVRAMVGGLAGSAPDDKFCEACHRATAGNPL